MSREEVNRQLFEISKREGNVVVLIPLIPINQITGSVREILIRTNYIPVKNEISENFDENEDEFDELEIAMKMSLEEIGVKKDEKNGGGDRDELKELIEKISHDPHFFQQLSKEQQQNVEILQEAIKPNKDGEYANYSFIFVKDDQQNVTKEIEELKTQQKMFEEYTNNPKKKRSVQIDFIRKLGKGAFGRTYTFRMVNDTQKKSNIVTEPDTFVLKISNKIFELNENWIDRDCLYLKYHRNVAPVLFHNYQFQIDFRNLPDFEDHWKKRFEGEGCKIFVRKRSVIILKFHRKDLNKYVKERVDIHKPFQNIEFCYILRGILRGANHLHDNFIVHRDLYPDNIFVSEAYGRVWIGDFGCSLDLRKKKSFIVRKEEFDEFCTSNEYFVMGGYASRYHQRYLAPEISKFDEDEDMVLDYTKSDLFSIGMIAKFMILCFYSQRKELENVNQYLLSPDITRVIKKLLIEEPSKRLGFEQSIRDIEKVTSFFEGMRGKLTFDFFQEDQKINLEKKWKKYFHEAFTSSQFGKVPESLQSFEKCLQILERHFPQNHSDIYTINFHIGDCKELLYEYSSSMECYQKCLKIARDHFPNDVKKIGDCYSSIGGIYLRLRQFEKARELMEKSLKMVITYTPEIKKDIVAGYGNLAFLHKEMKQFSKALEYLQKCLRIQEELIQSKYEEEIVRIDITYFHLADILREQQKFTESLEYYQKSMDYVSKHFPKNHPEISRCLINMGGVYSNNLKDYRKSLECYFRTLKILEKSYPPNHPAMIITYKNIGLDFLILEKYEESLKYFEMGLPKLQEYVDETKRRIKESRK